MLRVLTDPAAFFEEESENPDLLTPALIVIATALLTVTSYVPMYNYIEQSLTGDAAQAFSFLYISALVGGFLGDIIVWVIATAIVYAITAVAFDGEGSFTNTLALFGWGFVPSVIAGAISTAGYYWIFSSRPPGSVSDPRQIRRICRASRTSRNCRP